MSKDTTKNHYGWLGGAALALLLTVFGLGVYFGPSLRSSFDRSSVTATNPPVIAAVTESASENNVPDQNEAVIPTNGVELPVTWGGLGKQMVSAGVIDRQQFVYLYNERPGFGPDEQKLLDGDDNGRLKITPENSGFLLNMLWALGLGNKNPILDTGPMVDERYGGAGGFASTGGWTLAKGDPMDHYSKHAFIKLTEKEQALVEKVSQGIYRPCCNNSTYFPDCNHGMAMLGLLELMAAQGVSEEDMYKAALQVNSYWFPDTYLTLAAYQAKQNVAWGNVDARTMLSAEYSSSAGYRAIRAQVEPVSGGSGSGCGV